MNLASGFFAAAERDPGRCALRIGDREIAYAELRRSALGIAATIAAVPTERCLLLADKTVTGFASVLGTLAAGATYVPLNPRYPLARNAYIAQRAQATTLVVDSAQSTLAAELLTATDIPLRVLLPDEDTVPAALATLNRHTFVTGRSRNPVPLPLTHTRHAYLLFTSGSTGQPKGVAVRHESALDYVASMLARYRPTPEDRFSQLFDFTFDLSVHDMFVCWAAGACLVPATKTDLLMPERYARRHALSFWFSVPSLGAQLGVLGARSSRTLDSLRFVLFCGEALPVSVARSWHAIAPNAVIENLYGPTEATIAITAHTVDAKADGALVPIGRPLPGQEAIVVREGTIVAKPNETGELYLGGTQVADGYWQDPASTARAFVEARFEGCSNTRWYRTGDVASVDPHGDLLFHGRRDRQIKLRGFRVELIEIEEALRHAGALEAAVVPWPPASDNTARELIAFVRQPEDEAAIKRRLEAVLPDYMRPTRVLVLDALPLNDNGKTDYRQLEDRYRSLLERAVNT